MLAHPGTPVATSHDGSFGLVEVAEHAAGSGVAVAVDADLLFLGHYAREHADLVLSDAHHRVVVRDYFAGDARPLLRTADGASLPGATIDALVRAETPQQVAETGGEARSATRPVGRVETAEGNATATRNGVTVALHLGDPVYKGDVVQTDDGGRLAITFVDGTAFNLDGESRMVVDGMNYQPGASGNSALFSLVQGAITFVAGQTAKTGDMKVSTPTATMGIRGTAVHVEIASDRGAVKFSVMTEPDGHTGRYDVFANDDPGHLLFTVSDPSVITSVKPDAQGQFTIASAAKTGIETAHESALLKNVFATVASGVQAPIPLSAPAAGGSSTAPNLVLPERAGPPAPVTPTIQETPGSHSQADPAGRGAIAAAASATSAAQDPAQAIATVLTLTTSSHAQPRLVPAQAPVAAPAQPTEAASSVSTAPVIPAVPAIATPSAALGPLVPVVISEALPSPVSPAKTVGTPGSEPVRAVETPAGPGASAATPAQPAAHDATTPTAADNAPKPSTPAHETPSEPSAPVVVTPTPAQPAAHDATPPVEDDAPKTPQAPAPIPDGPAVMNVGARVDAAARLDVDAAHGLLAKGAATGLSVTAIGLSGQSPTAIGAHASTLAGQYGTLTVYGDGSYSYSADHAASLAMGEAAVDAFIFKASDGAGHTALATLAMSVIGVNDAPTVTGALSASAQVGGRVVTVDLLAGAADIDHGDGLSIASLNYAVNGSSVTRGLPGGLRLAGDALTIDPNDVAIHLAPGQHETVVVGYDIVDRHGGAVHQSLTLALSAPETAPILATDTGVHTLSERIGLTGSAAQLSTSVTLPFTDADHGDAHTAGVALSRAVWSGGTTLPGGLTDALAAAASVSLTGVGALGTGALKVAFTASDKTFDFLAAGETLSLTYAASVTDLAGSVSTQPVTILVSGANDAPVFDGPSTTTGRITGSDPGTAFEHAAGSLHFTDVDLTDRPTVSVSAQTVVGVDASGHALSLTTAQIAAVEHAFTVSRTGTNVGTVGWAYDLADGAFAFLDAGQSLTVTSTVLLDDHHGGQANQDVTVSLTNPLSVPVGLSALPDIDGVAHGGTITADAAHGLLANDGGHGSNAGLSVVSVAGAIGLPQPVSALLPLPILGAYGTLTLRSDGSYSYHANTGSSPAHNSVAQDVFAYTVSDGHGHTAAAALTVTVVNDGGVTYVKPTGVNDGTDHALAGTTGSKVVLDGGNGDDHLTAGNGQTVLIGGPGNDDMTGGNAPSVFVFATGFGHDVIHGFDIHKDTLQFDHAVFGSAAAVLSHAADGVGGVTITDAAGDTLSLLGVSKQALTAHTDAFYIV